MPTISSQHYKIQSQTLEPKDQSEGNIVTASSRNYRLAEPKDQIWLWLSQITVCSRRFGFHRLLSVPAE